MRTVTRYFESLEDVLHSQFLVHTSENSSDKGENREEILVRLLNETLPSIAVAHRGGIILDRWDEKSTQTDIVVYSSFAPLLHHNRKPLFLADGTFAAIEVKSFLDRESLLSAMEWSKKVKSLEKGIRRGMAFGPTSEKICTGLFAFSSKWKTPKTIFEILHQYRKRKTPNTQMLDFICINRMFCICRALNEYTSDVASPDNISVEKFREKATYMALENALGSMMARILEYLSCFGITDLHSYLCPTIAIGERTRSVGLPARSAQLIVAAK